MKTKDSNTVKCFLNGNDYEVRRIVKSTAVLESEDARSQISTEVNTSTHQLKEKKTIL
jgi:hypothetical protein